MTLMPVEMRSSASEDTASSAMGSRGARAGPRPFGAATTRSSTSVFQPWQFGQRPIHFGN